MTLAAPGAFLPAAQAVVSVQPLEYFDNVVRLRYKLCFHGNEPGTNGTLKIFFTAFSVSSPSAQGSYQLEANLYSMWVKYPDQGCAPWPPQRNGANFQGQAGLWISVPDYPQLGLVGIRQADDRTLAMFPRISTGIDNIPGLTKIETISQTNLNGEDVELEFSRGDTFSAPLSGWGSRINPTNISACVADLIGGTLYRAWNVECRFRGEVYRLQYAVPDAQGQYISASRLLNLVTEFDEMPGFFRIYAWDFAVQAENDAVWRPLKKWAMTQAAKPEPTPGSMFGCRPASYRGRPAIEFSNDGTGPYAKFGETFELATDLGLDSSATNLVIYGASRSRYSIFESDFSLPLRWNPIGEALLGTTPGHFALDGSSGIPARFFKTTSTLNYAPGATARQSSDLDAAHGAALAIDGNTDGAWAHNSVAHTLNTDDPPWWEVDLETPRTIGRIDVWFRTDCCQFRNDDFKVVVLDAGRTEVGRRLYTGRPPARVEYTFDPPLQGQIVRVEGQSPRRTSDGYLSLAEVEVLAPLTIAPVGP